MLGAAGGWWIGARGGLPLLQRYGRYIHVTEARIARADRWFDRFEGIAVPLGFATPLIRSFVAIPAGMFEIGLRRFLLSAFVGITVFCAVIAGIGWAVGTSWSSAHSDLTYIDIAVAVLAVIVVAYLLVRHRRSINMAEQCRFPTLTSRRNTRR